MPDLLELLGDRPRHPARSRHLVTATGEVLTGDATLAGSAVPDGSVLRLVRSDEPLPAPVVHDVPEAVDEVVGSRPWRWSPQAAEWTAVVATAVVGLALALVETAGGMPYDPPRMGRSEQRIQRHRQPGLVRG